MYLVRTDGPDIVIVTSFLYRALERRTDRQRERERERKERERERETVYRSSHQTPVGKCPRQSIVPRPGDSYCPALEKEPNLNPTSIDLSLKPKTLTFITLLTIRHTTNMTRAISFLQPFCHHQSVLFLRVETI